MARFNVGQIVELDAWGFGEGGRLQTGDRGTVVVGGRMNEFDAMVARVQWHKTGRVTDMVEHRLRVYTHPADAPGRSHGAFATMQALQIVMKEEQPHAVAEVLREMERARMTAEDLRGAALSPYPAGINPHSRCQTWREFAENRNDKCAELGEQMGEALETLRSARRDVLAALPGPVNNHRAALNAVDASMITAMQDLGDDSSDEEDVSDDSSDEVDNAGASDDEL